VFIPGEQIEGVPGLLIELKAVDFGPGPLGEDCQRPGSGCKGGSLAAS
jgi:hypothetical protein